MEIKKRAVIYGEVHMKDEMVRFTLADKDTGSVIGTIDAPFDAVHIAHGLAEKAAVAYDLGVAIVDLHNSPESEGE